MLVMNVLTSLFMIDLNISLYLVLIFYAADHVDNETVLQQASNMVRTKYGIHFSTIQVETYQPIAMTNCVRCSQPCWYML